MKKQIIDNCTLYQGDCLQVLLAIPDNSVDAIITDPPYSSGGMFRSDRLATTGNKYTTSGKPSAFANFPGDNRDQRSFSFWVSMWLAESYRVLKEGSPICLFTDWRQYPVMSDILQAAGFSWRGAYVWDKKNARPNKGRFRQTAEFVLWGSKGPMENNDRGVGCLPGMASCAVNKGGRFHQTGKPVEVMKEVVAITEPGGTILDPFMGSGSTGMAAKATGRPFIGIEYTEHYFDVSVKRLERCGV